VGTAGGRRVQDMLTGAACAAVVAAVAAIPIGAPVVVGGAVHPVVTPGEPGHEWLLLTARVRRTTVADIVLDRAEDRADGAAPPADDPEVAAWDAVRDLIGPVPEVAGLLVVDLSGDGRIARVVSTDDTGATVIADVPAGVLGPRSSWTSAVLAPLPTTPPVVDHDQVDGASLGLLIGLVQLDALTFGDLTGDAAVAVTGTLGANGAVGSVRGMPAKASAATRHGATLLLAPRTNADDLLVVLSGAELRVRTPATLVEAVADLCDLGGESSICRD
jgi:hypothetical protein